MRALDRPRAATSPRAQMGEGSRCHAAPAAILWVALASWSGPAVAQDEVSVSVSSTVALGEAPAVTLKVKKDLASAKLEVRGRGPGAPSGAAVVRGGPTPAGQSLVLRMPEVRQVGEIAWQGTLLVTFADGAVGSMPLSFVTRQQGPPTLAVVDGGVDLEGHKVTVTLSRPARQIDLEVTGEDGELLANVAETFEGAPAGTPLEVRWAPRSPARVMRLRLVGHDTDGFFSEGLELSPWSLHIEHQEVVFESDQSALQKSEEAKLEAVLPEVKKLTQRYRKVVDVKLYIMGHTDTVGPDARNRKLSRARAETIARWFRKRGVDVPVLVRGFGEDMPRVSTPDDTDDIRNRRVDYVLSVNPPVEGPGWSRVR